MKNMLKLGLSLAVFASVACVLLALVNNATAPVIALSKQAEVNKGLSVVFPDSNSFEAAPNFTPELSGTVKIEALYLAKENDVVKGAVVQASGPTYDKASILIGIDMARTITGIQFLSISDTPGFGQKATEPEFYTQFAGKSIDDDFEAGKDVDSISGATITTKGVAQIVKYASYIAGEYLATNYGADSSSGASVVIAQPATVFTYEEAYSSLFPPSQFPSAQFTEINVGLDRIVSNMVVKKQVIVTIAGKPIGAMVAVSGQSYKTSGTVLTAVDSNNIILGTRIIQLADTPNLGQLALEEDFYGQFSNKSVTDNLLINTDFDIISGATITSACVADMVKVGAVEASHLLSEYMGKSPLAVGEYRLNKIYRED